jgi:hypothetical protein
VLRERVLPGLLHRQRVEEKVRRSKAHPLFCSACTWREEIGLGFPHTLGEVSLVLGDELVSLVLAAWARTAVTDEWLQTVEAVGACCTDHGAV